MVYQTSTPWSAYGMIGNVSHISRRTSGNIPLRVFLVQTARGLFSSSGGYKANICLLRHLASRGHSVRQICYSNRGEIEEYAEKLAKTTGHDPLRRSGFLHLDSKDGSKGVDIKVEKLIMEDGVQIVSLETEAFEEAFGGKEKIHSILARETVNYIEVSLIKRCLSLQHCLSCQHLIVPVNRLGSWTCRYSAGFLSCRRKSEDSRQRTSFVTMAFLCKQPPLRPCQILKRFVLASYTWQNSCLLVLSQVDCLVTQLQRANTVCTKSSTASGASQTPSRTTLWRMGS